MPSAPYLRGTATEVVCADAVQVVQKHLRLVQEGVVPRILHQHNRTALDVAASAPVGLYATLHFSPQVLTRC